LIKTSCVTVLLLEMTMFTVYLRKRPEFRHENLRQVMITGFRASKCLVELVIYILEIALRLSASH
jgi:hypothetical protein